MFEDFDWGKVLTAAVPAAIQAGAGYFGAKQVANANQNAANVAAGTGAQQQQVIAANNTQAQANIAAANAAAQARLGAVEARSREIAAPGVSYMRGVVAQDPNALSPDQVIQMKDAQNQVNASIGANPSLAGGGQSVAAIYNNVINRSKAGMIEANRGRRTVAANSLAGNLNPANAAATQAANIDTAGGRDIANINVGQGAATSNIIGQAGGNQAQAIVDTANSNAGTLGQLAGYFADSVKGANRGSRYDEYKAARA